MQISNLSNQDRQTPEPQPSPEANEAFLQEIQSLEAKLTMAEVQTQKLKDDIEVREQEYRQMEEKHQAEKEQMFEQMKVQYEEKKQKLAAKVDGLIKEATVNMEREVEMTN